MHEAQEKKAAVERGGKDGEAPFGDRAGDGSMSKSVVKNLFNSEFLFNLTDHEFLKHK